MATPIATRFCPLGSPFMQNIQLLGVSGKDYETFFRDCTITIEKDERQFSVNHCPYALPADLPLNTEFRRPRRHSHSQSHWTESESETDSVTVTVR